MEELLQAEGELLRALEEKQSKVVKLRNEAKVAMNKKDVRLAKYKLGESKREEKKIDVVMKNLENVGNEKLIVETLWISYKVAKHNKNFLEKTRQLRNDKELKRLDQNIEKLQETTDAWEEFDIKIQELMEAGKPTSLNFDESELEDELNKLMEEDLEPIPEPKPKPVPIKKTSMQPIKFPQPATDLPDLISEEESDTDIAKEEDPLVA
jgi:hypothetical protein